MVILQPCQNFIFLFSVILFLQYCFFWNYLIYGDYRYYNGTGPMPHVSSAHKFFENISLCVVFTFQHNARREDKKFVGKKQPLFQVSIPCSFECNVSQYTVNCRLPGQTDLEYSRTKETSSISSSAQQCLLLADHPFMPQFEVKFVLSLLL